MNGMNIYTYNRHSTCQTNTYRPWAISPPLLFFCASYPLLLLLLFYVLTIVYPLSQSDANASCIVRRVSGFLSSILLANSFAWFEMRYQAIWLKFSFYSTMFFTVCFLSRETKGTLLVKITCKQMPKLHTSAADQCSLPRRISGGQ